MAAYRTNNGRYMSAPCSPSEANTPTIPANRAPAAPPKLPSMSYSENNQVRRSSAAVWGRTACSTVRNGPTSEFDTLMVPVKAPSSRVQKLSVSANARPPSAINTAMMATVRRRPKWSASIDQKMFMSAEPARAPVSTRPI